MAASPPPPNAQDFAPESGIVQSPRTSLDDFRSFIYLHSTCPTCHHWYNKHKIPDPFPRGQTFEVKCPKCHKKLFRVGTQSSQESFMTQATDVPNSRTISVDRASLQCLLDSSACSSPRPRPPTRRTHTEPVSDTVLAEQIEDEEDEDVSSRNLETADGEPEELHHEPPLDLLGIGDRSGTDPAFNQSVQDVDYANPTAEIRLTEEEPMPVQAGMNIEQIPEQPHPASLRDSVSPSAIQASKLKSRHHKFTKENLKLLHHKISRYIKNKAHRILSLGVRHRIIQNPLPPAVSVTPVQAEQVIDEFDPKAFGPHEAAGPYEAAPGFDEAVQEANVNTDKLHGLTVPRAVTSRGRSMSSPADTTEPSPNTSTALTEDDSRRKRLRQEMTRQAKEKEQEHRRCPCWPQCACYPDGPRSRLERAQTMPSRPLTCISSVRDALGNDEFYQDVRYLAQEARAQQTNVGTSNVSSRDGLSADRASDQVPTLDGTGTTISTGLPSNSDSFPPPGTAIYQLHTTDLDTEALDTGDQTPTPTQANNTYLLHIGGLHDDRNDADTDGANQRN